MTALDSIFNELKFAAAFVRRNAAEIERHVLVERAIEEHVPTESSRNVGI
jgi:hypothetical protein